MGQRVVKLRLRQKQAKARLTYGAGLFAGAPKIGAESLQSAYTESMLSISGSRQTVDNLKKRQAAAQLERYEKIIGMKVGSPEWNAKVDGACNALLG